MTDRNQSDGRNVRSGLDAVYWDNVAGATIPAYGVVQLRTNFSTVNKASKPNAGSGLFFANGPIDAAVGARGESRSWMLPRLVMIDGAPTVGDEVGPVADEWFMSSAGTGFRVIHQPVGGVGTVTPVGGGGGGGGLNAWATVEEVVCDLYGDPLLTYVLATVTWFSGGCEASIPGEDEYTGRIEVHQICDIFTAYYTSAELVGKTIEVGYYYPRTGSCVPKWILRQVCGAPECA